MPKPRISDTVGAEAVRRALATVADRDTEAIAVRYLLQLLADDAPGNSVEVRVPPFGAVQCIEGPGHTRGTPPNVVETDALTWLAIATGGASWAESRESGRIAASGSRADLGPYLPLDWARDGGPVGAE
ncbi:MAG TPA: sterol carrier family protein [Lacisediminihabitans sp.]|uniref:sterol carrier family protein n=1 Tax=Lacisediminihabitans sp. TaxID=2787631 RepID=UPI002ED9A121